MEPPHILLVEDMTKILNYNRMALEKRGYRVTAVRTLSEARKRIEDAPPDLAVVDILLPDGSGLDLCRQLRHSDAPILLLTSLGDSDQIVRGLQAGGDDYIIKPYKIEELIARIEAQLRRVHWLLQAEVETHAGRLVLNARMQRAFLGGHDLLLKPKEFLLLSTLLRNRGRTMSAEELYSEIWGQAPNVALRTVFVNISSLRIKLRKNAGECPSIVIERSNGGYRLVFPDEKQGGRE